MDEVDRAQEAQEQFLLLALENRPRDDDRPSRETCIDCEEPIPEARRTAIPGCERCVECQTDFEKGGH